MERYLTCEEVAGIARVRIRTVYSWINEGKLKASKPTRKKLLIKESDFISFMDSTVKEVQ